MTRETEVVLEEVSGPGSLTGTTKAKILRDGSTAKIIGAIVHPSTRTGSSFELWRGRESISEPSQAFTVNVALTAVSEDVEDGQALDLQDSNCPAPTSAKPTCGRLLLPAAAAGHVVMSVGSCDGLGCDDDGPKALVVTAIFNGDYSGLSPATVILACDKVVCGQSGSGAGLPLTVIYTFENDAGLKSTAPACAAKGLLGPGEPAICVDYVSSSRHQGDLYTHVLLGHDVRLSHP